MYGDQGTSDKYEEDKNNGDCDTGSVRSFQVDDDALYVRKGLVETLIFVFCEHWFHKMCNGIKGSLRYVPDYKCRKCAGEVRPFEGLPAESVVSNESLEVVNKFCYFV